MSPHEHADPSSAGPSADASGILQCPSCEAPLPDPAGREYTSCPACGFDVTWNERAVSYDYQSLLRGRFPRAWFRNQVLQANGIVGYVRLADSSLSVSGREDVERFGSFIAQHHGTGRILDVGCGPLVMPGYLEGVAAELHGLDPEDSDFAGHFTKGAIELAPYRDGTFSTVVFATSVDHVCDLPTTIAETRRVLADGGFVLIWTGAIEPPSVASRLRSLAGRAYRSLCNVRRFGWQARHAWVYDNGTVLVRPTWAVDPFHVEHLPHSEYARRFARGGFELVAVEQPVAGSAFIALRKAR